MLLTITYTGAGRLESEPLVHATRQDATELGYLLYKNPYRPQVFELNHGKAYVFYPEISEERTTAALLLDIDPIDLARGKADSSAGGLFDYVNDRPYVSSSFMSVAISKVFGTAMTGRADSRQALSDSALDLTATITMLPCRGEQTKLNHVFEPLGYEVTYESFTSDEKFPDWGDSKYVNLTISGKVRLRDLLKHLYVLIPVFDRQKHYWVGKDEVQKLMRLGEDWLPNHPEKTYIIGRYLNRQRSLVNMAFERLAASENIDEDSAETIDTPNKSPNLNTQRIDSVVTVLKNCNVKSVIDVGCGEGRLLKVLLRDRQFSKIAGMDVSHVALKRANERLKLEDAGDALLERIQLFQGSLTYKDSRLSGYDAACVIEVIEHMDISRLSAFERVLFEFAKPPVVVLTTPNKKYNTKYGLLEGMRHSDHRFEWTREEFQNWAEDIAVKYGYAVEFSDIGDVDVVYGAPTQMGVFTLDFF